MFARLRELPSQITEFARSKRSSEWVELVSQGVNRLRALIRENGEKAAILAFGVGIFVVIFFKIFLLLLAISTLAFLTLLWLAER